MAQFDVHRTLGEARKIAPFLVDLQTTLLDDAPTRIVAPLRLAKDFGPTVRTLHVKVAVQGRNYVLSPEELASIPAQALGPIVDSLAGQRAAIVAALDLLFTGV